MSDQQPEDLPALAQGRVVSRPVTRDDGTEELHRTDFYDQMAAAEHELREDADRWESYISERNEWLDPDWAIPDVRRRQP